MIHFSHTEWMIAMYNVRRLQAEEETYRKQLFDSGYKTMLRQEQTSVDLLEDTLCKIKKPGDSVLDMCCRTSTHGLACLLLQPHCEVVGCKSDENFLAEAMSFLVSTFCRHNLKKDSDLTASQDVMGSTKTLGHAFDRRAAKKRADVGNAPKQPTAVQTIPKYILHFMSMYSKDGSLCKTCHNNPFAQWSQTSCGRLNGVDVSSLPTECDALAETIMKSRIYHPTAR